MIDPIVKVLADISVRSKLTLGFALVLLLTLVIAGIGLGALSSLGERSAKLSSIAHINEETRDVRIARLNYTVSPGAEQAAQMVKAMDELNLRIEALAKQFTDPNDLRWIGQAEQAIEAYRSHFQDYVRAVEARSDAQAVQTLRCWSRI